MVEKTSEEHVDLDRFNDGVSEIRPYKSKQAKEEEKAKRKQTKAKNKLKESSIAALVISIVFFLVVVGYTTVAFGHIPFVQKWRNIWIETAMTTDQHRWLATSFFPEWLIDDVMSRQVDIKDMGFTDIDPNSQLFGGVVDPTELTVGEPDAHGNTVYANNIEEGIVIIEVKKTNFVGKLVIIDDPSRVFLGVTDYKNSRGEFICDYLEKENAIVGINASGFIDTGGVSLGGEISGMCVSEGEYWGYYKSKYTLVGFDEDNRLIVGGTDDWEQYNIRDGMQFRPTLIINGEKVVEDSAGWGLQPRTTIGQCANGVVLMLVADGRQVGYSLGATMEDCADILLEYGAVTAAACDGGSSSVIGYDGEIINKPSTDMPTGRYLPNAWLVRSKK
ncbi:MAG: phosphodiester glycosidase family protein [Clostridia bacterium]|nr:phosphodiester glycosidase family protein [Clostridia bacterium]